MKSILRVIAISALVVALPFVGSHLAQALPATTTTNTYIVKFKPAANRAAEVADARAKGLTVSREFTNAFSGMVVSMTPAQSVALKNRPTVEVVELDSKVAASDTQTGATWGIDRVDQRSLPLDGSYSYATNSGLGVKAYVIDTGLLATHSEFTGRVATGWSTIDNTPNTTDCNGHGSHVAGTVAGTRYGIAKSATIIPIRVLDCAGSGSMSGVIAGVDWVIADHQAGVPAVANLSLGGGASATLDTAIQSLTNDGVTVAVAAGNSATDACTSSPARAPSALTVAASDSTDTQASFSNFGSCVDLYGPGVSISSAWYTSTTAVASLSGTSMASPHVAGVAAALLSQNPTWTPAQVTSAVLGNATQSVVKSATTGTPNRLLYNGSAGSTTPTTPSTPGVTAPSAPTNVVAQALKSRSAKLTWTQGANGGAALTKQTIIVYQNGRLQSSVTASPSATSATLSGLVAGKSYRFAVTATNEVGTSASSPLSNSIIAIR